ncbi:MAG: acetolactate synthase small subunit [Clostridia bacterium]|nr:acetolactate synthase small subunit [Clostridia bacterium]
MQDKQIISILVNNQPGVLSRISGLFSRRGYSRMTRTVTGNSSTIKQIVAQLEKQEDVVKVMGFDGSEVVFRELLLIKIGVTAERRSQIVDLCTLFSAKAIDITVDSMVLELTGSTEKVDAFIQTLSPFTILEIARTGGAALQRGNATKRKTDKE